MATKQNARRKSKGRLQHPVRVGWAEAFARMAATKDDAWVQGPVESETEFEATEWCWLGTRKKPHRQGGATRTIVAL